MEQTKNFFGRSIIIVIFLMFFYEKFTSNISTTIGHLYCGKDYMKKVNGIAGDPSCGFKIDMYLSATLVLLLILGIVLSISSNHQKKDKKEFS